MKVLTNIIIFLAFDNAALAVRVGIIYNTLFTIVPPASITMNGSTCHECVCAMLKSTGNSSIVSFHCYKKSNNSVECQLFTKSNYSLSHVSTIGINVNITFYFLQLPPNNQSIIATTNTVTSSEASITSTSADTSSAEQIFWPFDSNYDDFYGVYNGVGRNNPTFVSPGYTGYGSALSLQAAQSQYVLVPRFLNMTYQSFTWELWAYPTSLANLDHVMVSMCQSTTTDRCLFLIVRRRCSYFAFYNNDCNGLANVSINQWHHFAFIYDYDINTQNIYMNGDLVCRGISRGPFLGDSGAITIGASNISQTLPSLHWDGYIDQLSYVARAKTAAEVLTDATLVAHYSFDNGSFDDSGPNKINGTGFNVSSSHGRINQGILFNTSNAYFQAGRFTLLGAPYRSYSIALWVYRIASAVAKGTILHLSGSSAGVQPWCLPIVGLSISKQIVGQNFASNLASVSVTGPILLVDVWTHIVTSYSPANGVRLWVNGSLIGASGPFNYNPSGVPNFITLASMLSGVGHCFAGSTERGQFYGIMDELRIYSRELNASDVYILANP